MTTIAKRLASRDLVGGLNAQTLGDRFSRRGPPTDNPVGAVRPQDVAGFGILQNIARARQAAGEDVTIPTEQEARKQVAANVNRVNSTLRPTKKGVAALRQYVKAAYPDGKGMPAYIRDALEAERRGGMNDVVLAENVERDIRRRQQAGLPVVAMPGYLLEADQAVGNLITGQNAEALASAQSGLLGDLVPAALSLFNPAAGALAGGLIGLGEKDPFKVGGAILGGAAATGAFDDLLAKGKSALGLAEKGFSNPDALGLTQNPGALKAITPNFASGAVPTSNIPWIQGFEGITGNALGNLGLEGLESASKTFAQNFQPVRGLEGLDPKSLFRSRALGEVRPPDTEITTRTSTSTSTPSNTARGNRMLAAPATTVSSRQDAGQGKRPFSPFRQFEIAIPPDVPIDDEVVRKSAVDPKFRKLKAELAASLPRQREQEAQRAYERAIMLGETRTFKQWLKDDYLNDQIRLFESGRRFSEEENEILRKLERRLGSRRAA